MKAIAISVWSWLTMFGALVMRSGQDILFTLAFSAMSYGFWLAWPPLGFIVSGGLVCVLMVWSRQRPPDNGAGDNA